MERQLAKIVCISFVICIFASIHTSKLKANRFIVEAALHALGAATGETPLSESVALNQMFSTFQFAGSCSPRIAIDWNPDPNIVEVVFIAFERKLTLGTGQKIDVYTFNGSIPGPTIKAKKGDTVIVHFLNWLPEDSTIHWHGIDNIASMDGSNISQLPVNPGGYFRYEFPVLTASTFWYHPHINTAVQVERGLYGGMIIDDRKAEKGLGLPKSKHLLVLDDVLLDSTGQIAPPDFSDPLVNSETQLNGREGNVLLVNGCQNPNQWIRNGKPQRLRIVNVANSRFMRIGIPGHSLYQIGGDGGLLENPIVHPPIDPSSTDGGLVLTPGERADVIFIPNGNGPYELTWFDTARGRHTTFYNPDGTIGIGHAHDDGKRPSQVLMTFQTYGKKFNGNTSVPANLRTIAPINTAGASTIPVMFGHSTPDATGNVTFFVAMKNGMPLPFPAVTPADAPAVNVGETRIWEVTNLTGGDHNFHSHGFTFQHIETEFIDAITPANNYVVPASHLENKDTFRVPRRPGAKGTSRVIVRFAAKFTDEGREGLTEAYGKVPSATTSGGWLFHCHILEHSRNGMMSFLQVFND